MGYGLDGPMNDPRLSGIPPILFPAGERYGCENDQSPEFVVKVKNVWSYTSITAFMVCIGTN
jgi:hypothetical protein